MPDDDEMTELLRQRKRFNIGSLPRPSQETPIGCLPDTSPRRFLVLPPDVPREVTETERDYVQEADNERIIAQDSLPQTRMIMVPPKQNMDDAVRFKVKLGTTPRTEVFSPPDGQFGRANSNDSLSEKLLLPVDARRISDQSEYRSSVNASKWNQRLMSQDVSPNMELVMVVTDSISDSQTDPDATKRSGKTGMIRSDMTGVPPNVEVALLPVFGLYDNVSKLVSRLVASRKQFLSILRSSDSSLTDWGDFQPYPTAAKALLGPVGGTDECYTIASGDDAGVWRRVTFNIEGFLQTPALQCIFKVTRANYAPYTGEFYYSLNDTIDMKKKTVETTAQTMSPKYRGVFGEERMIDDRKVSSITFHTKFQLSSIYVIVHAY